MPSDFAGTSITCCASDNSVTPVDDNIVEPDQTVILTLVSGASYTAGSPSAATVTVADNDTASATVTAMDAAASEAGADPGTFRVALAAGTEKDLTINYSLAGTAANGTDYTSLSGSVVIAAGQTSATVTVSPVDDSLVESAETAVLTLAAGTGYTFTSPSSATVSVADNDADYVTAPDMLAELRDDNQQLASRMRQAHVVCEEHGDVATASLIEVWIDEAERRVWFLYEAGRR